MKKVVIENKILKYSGRPFSRNEIYERLIDILQPNMDDLLEEFK